MDGHDLTRGLAVQDRACEKKKKLRSSHQAAHAVSHEEGHWPIISNLYGCVATIESSSSSAPVLLRKATTWRARLGAVRTASDCKSKLISSADVQSESATPRDDVVICH